MISIKSLSKSYGNNKVLKDFNISFETGKAYGIVGVNGAGKTTLFNCIAGLEHYAGDINHPYDRLKDHLGYLQAEPFFFTRITGQEHLQLFANAAQLGSINFEMKNIFDLPLNQYASNYSTGMKKKLAITAILLQGNDIFILDEPYNGVDIQSNIIITEIIKKLKSLGKTILISSHIFSTLKDTCDEIHLLEAGQFTRRAMVEEFDALDEEMKATTIGDRINEMGLE